ncbi:MAG: NADH-quinone oxidoreductase subunit NuoN [Xanthomonadales bacterium PRO6]|nr:NADH-quinone oxidoreductase subunit N [Xanthomonadales bacterium]MCE7930885.1 NADH-quinone oxidoreductase subunit NuoN [Xanthomonadales bacterium PRO6]
MIDTWTDLLPMLPELFLLGMVNLILIAGLFIDERRRGLVHFIATLTLAFAAILTLRDFDIDGRVAVAGGMFIRDGAGDVLKLFVYLTMGIVFVYAKFYLRTHKLFVAEFYTLALFSVLGMCVLISGGNLLTIYLGLELMALSSYALVALDRDSPVAAESAMKYFVLGALASGLLLYGMSILYGVTGSLDLSEIATRLSSGEYPKVVLAFAVVFIVVGIGFKFGAVPFHMWVPDVYQGAPTAITLLLASAPKLAAVGMTFRLLSEGLEPLARDWSQMLGFLALMSLVVGNFAAIAQTNLKRMLAYSTISHVGFVLLGILAGSDDGMAAAMFYAITYALMTTGAFGMIIALSNAGFECERIEDFKGLNQRNPWFAFLMLLILASLAGFPPLVGFFSKLYVLQAAINAGWLWLTVVAVVMAVIGAYYYLRVIKVMYFDEPEHEHALQAPGDVRVVLAANGLLQLLLTFFVGSLTALCVAAWQ